MHSSIIAGVVAAVLFAAPAGATVLTATLPEFNGPVNPRGLIPIGAFTFQIPAGEKGVGAKLTGAFGNSQHNSSAIGDLFIDGLLVAHCSDPSPCDNGPGQRWTSCSPRLISVCWRTAWPAASCASTTE